ncbi:fatty acid--CoA ligase family protein [Spirulina subsalsa FACHB-351]|uniref:Fatty acid--CoA ligase family protein n=1 Tax=Spirulina subsalsa FACHB-351 TaxID=234711 RepID=A0ABT3L367_9CYAN|nr:fatty acid--CoA ligase family protein [Spirulina subsalsa]MCW6035951.1 fatty acid--CoA ligase family protein [Spirulina subsalsa FACHB-351]
MYIDFFQKVFREYEAENAIVWKDEIFSYGWLLETLDYWLKYLEEQEIKGGTIVSLEADFSPNAIALFLALLEKGCILVPLTDSVAAKKIEFRQIAQVEVILTIDEGDNIRLLRTNHTVDHEILVNLQEKQEPGLVLFSSGSTGKSKAAVHNFVPLLEKFKVPRHSFRTLTFLLFDHIGGINTLLYSLANGGFIVTLQDRSPDAICGAIANYQLQLLPASPTLLNLILLSEAYQRHDLSSLEVITYGTEVMPESTLTRLHHLFPKVKLLQTYGLSEVGILRSKSRDSNSLWFKIGGEGFETRIVEGKLEIRAQSAMLGYLNAPNPFTEDGWFKTGDAVEVDGEYIRILGRTSELINVGGEKVYPIEVESTLMLMEGIEDVAVNGVSHPITGQIVQARVKLKTSETLPEFRKRMWQFCQDKLAKYKIPQKVVLVEEWLHSDRFKKMRREVPANEYSQ